MAGPRVYAKLFVRYRPAVHKALLLSPLLKHSMYRITYILLFILASCSTKKNPGTPLVIDPSWQKKKISRILTISLPDSSRFNKVSILNASFGTGRFGLCGVDYYDTIIVYIENESDFQKALKGYIGGKLGNPQLNSYDLTVRDTTIGNSSGYFLTGFTNDTLQPYKYPFCYVTLADNNFYWFYSLQHTANITNETRQFFSSIQFARENLKEPEYQVPPTWFHKAIK
jgi:hypothetical protein